MYENIYHKEDFEGFIYIDTEFAPAAWNTTKGFFCSADILKNKFNNHTILSFTHAQMLNRNPKRLHVELCIEYIRKTYFPHHVSRFDGLFIFDDIQSISETWGSKNWGMHFNTDCLTDVGIASNRSSRVDANWITKIQDENNNICANWQQIAINYWSGNPHPELNPIWERIVEGYVTIWGKSIKEKAHIFLKKYFPHSLNILAYYINCNLVPSTCGQIFPYASSQNGILNISYYVDEYDKMELDFNERLFSAISKYPEKACIYYDKNEIMKLPDFYEYQIEIPFLQDDQFPYISLDEKLNFQSNIDFE